MPSLDDCASDVVRALIDALGRPDPPDPAIEPFEALVSVLLDRQPGVRSGPALARLRESGLLDPAAFLESEPRELADLLRGDRGSLRPGVEPTLRRLAAWFLEQGDLADRDTGSLRDELRSIKGIGPATADALLLLALHRPSYPVDRASYRVFLRHGWLDSSADYDEARDAIHRLSPEDDPAILAALSLAMDRLGRDHCRASAPRCDRCPLQPFLPDSGPIEPEP